MLRQIIRVARARATSTRPTAVVRCRFNTSSTLTESNATFPSILSSNGTENTRLNASIRLDISPELSPASLASQISKLKRKRDLEAAEILFENAKQNQPHEVTVKVCEEMMQLCHAHKDIKRASKLMVDVLAGTIAQVRVASRRLLGLYLNLAADYPTHLKVSVQALKHASEHTVELEHFHYWTIAAALIRASRFEEACDVLVLGKDTLDRRGVPMSTYEKDSFFRHATLMMALLHSDSATFQQHLNSLVAENAFDQYVFHQWLDALVGPGRGHFKLVSKLINAVISSGLLLDSIVLNRTLTAVCGMGDTQLAARVWALVPEAERSFYVGPRYMQTFNENDIQGYLDAMQQEDKAELDELYRLTSAAVSAARKYDFEMTAQVLKTICERGHKPVEPSIAQILCLASSAGVTTQGVRTIVKCFQDLQIEIPDRVWHRTFHMCSSGHTPDLLEQFYESYLKRLSDGSLKVTTEALTTATVAYGRTVSAEKAEAVFSKLVFDHGAEPSLQLFKLLYGAYDQLLSRSEHLHFYYIVQAAFPEPDQPDSSTTSDKMLISKMLEIMRTARQRAEDMVGKTRPALFWSTVGRFNIPVFDEAPTEYFVNELTKGRVGREPKQSEEQGESQPTDSASQEQEGERLPKE